MSPRARTPLFLLASTALFLLAANGIARVVLGPPERPHGAQCAGRPYLLDMCLPPGTREVEPVHLGDDERTVLEVTATINSRGFRAPEVARFKPPGVRRLVAVGDSVLYGWGVTDGAVYTDLLRARLAGAPELGRWEVINASAPGLSSAQVLGLWRAELAALDPDAVVVSVGPNDGSPPRVTTGGARMTDAELIARERAGGDGPVARWLGDLALVRGLARVVVPLRRAVVQAEVPPARVSVDAFARNLAAFAAEAGAQARLFFFAAGLTRDDPYGEAFYRAAAAADAPYFEITAWCRANEERLRTQTPEAELLTWYEREHGFALYPWNRAFLCTLDGTHLDRLGHFILAERLFEWIAAER